MKYKEEYTQWISDAYFDSNTRLELQGIADNEKEIEERFFKNLEFGTGGLRGVIGAGTNRMNVYTVRKVTQGLAQYIQKNGGTACAGGVAIAYDSRRFSKEFAETAALVMCANGIKAYLFESLRPTPELSFAVRHFGCTAGIVVTASHNPPEYNGYKVYWDDGAQVQYPKDQEIVDEVNAIGSFTAIKITDRESALESGMLVMAGKEVDDAFMACVMAQSMKSAASQKAVEELKVVYTPLNGAGNIPVRRALSEAGFKNVFIVPEQENPDPDFTTIGYPNPEDPKAFNLSVRLLEEKNADIAIATDPDSDRVGAVIKHKGEYVYFSGNIIGVLLTEFLLSQKQKDGTLPKNAAVISTIVSTEMTGAVCRAYGAAYYEVLTGFKYIGEKIKEFEENGSHTYIIGFEESIGYLIGTHSRDKDAVTASLLICEMAAMYKSRGLDLQDGINELYEKYGYYKEGSRSIVLPGLEGLDNMRKIMENLRNNPPAAVNGVKITEYRDYKAQTIRTAAGVKPSGLPVSDVLYYVLEDGGWFCVRPSGTEPKIKIYSGVRSGNIEAANSALSGLMDGVNGIVGSEV